jgi:hypothetical protein
MVPRASFSIARAAADDAGTVHHVVERGKGRDQPVDRVTIAHVENLRAERCGDFRCLFVRESRDRDACALIRKCIGDGSADA